MNVAKNQPKNVSFVSGKRDIQNYSKWREQWYPNLEDYARAEGAAGAENNTINNVTVQLGATAYLHCHVRSIADRALAGAEVSAITNHVCIIVSYIWWRRRCPLKRTQNFKRVLGEVCFSNVANSVRTCGLGCLTKQIYERVRN